MVKALKQESSDAVDQQDVTPDPVHHAIAHDEYAGKGGTYIYDPATGKRTPAPEPTE